MFHFLKNIIKKMMRLSPVGLTPNDRIDRLTGKVIKKVCRPDSICIDVGAHNGKILEMMIDAAPDATHWAFEPVPHLFSPLAKKFREAANIYSIALSDTKAIATFNLVISNLSYSGLHKRAYDKREEDTTIFVEANLLDNIIPSKIKIALIKIDVEGAELLVIKGGKQTIERSKPVILFEFGKGAADAYGNNPLQMFRFITEELHYNIFTLKGWLNSQAQLKQEDLSAYYVNGKEFFFLAAPVQA